MDTSVDSVLLATTVHRRSQTKRTRGQVSLLFFEVARRSKMGWARLHRSRNRCLPHASEFARKPALSWSSEEHLLFYKPAAHRAR
ncbi:hypothetical protein CBOM_00616 [Ceraceosorus bombacis]|uniref:Uncharacterized protein n=1 Tax=Ceraceosorus bombacis TaxID=401625 RepID=A0A0N7L930_9BASI|nr:hypothetical protein CBOM_00616 [Ceraceosorus bombacis]